MSDRNDGVKPQLERTVRARPDAQATVAAALRSVDRDAGPDTRVGGAPASEQSQLERMLSALPPLPVAMGVGLGLTLPGVLTYTLALAAAIITAVDVPFRGALVLGGVGLAGALVASFVPSLARYLFMAWSLGALGVVYIDVRFLERRRVGR